MQVTLDPKERDIFAWALNGVISDLGLEIADTEKHEYRQDLKERTAVLQAVLQKRR